MEPCKYPMISVENFYPALYHNLLRPVNFRMRYYYPFGTCQELIHYDDDASGRNFYFALGSPLVLFHFDQEPIYDQDRSVIENGIQMRRAGHRFPIILANSERSDLKKKICKELGLLDWYFFYHGFAALDWYRDMRLFNHQHAITHAFVSLNHLVTGRRAYRMAITARILERSIADRGLLSFHGTQNDCVNEINTKDSRLSDRSRVLIQQQLVSRSLPMRADDVTVTGATSAAFGHQEYHLRQKAAFCLVNETVFDDPKLHLTEKIFQPIVAGRPFILAAAPGNLEYLKSYGFQTFSRWIDESYDQEPDPDRRMDMIVDQLADLADRPLTELQSMIDDMRPVLKHNKRHFFGDFKRILAQELLVNFEQCLRIWNNGRTDDRDVPLHPDPESLESMFLS